MAEPEPGDILIRRAMGDGFDAMDAISKRHLARFATFSEAFKYALTQKTTVWQQKTDEQGRPVGDLLLALARPRDRK